MKNPTKDFWDLIQEGITDAFPPGARLQHCETRADGAVARYEVHLPTSNQSIYAIVSTHHMTPSAVLNALCLELALATDPAIHSLVADDDDEFDHDFANKLAAGRRLDA